jgi:hypothetical protein
MECPFCVEEIKDDALVCKHCGRDLKIPKHLIEENQELSQRIDKLQHEVSALRTQLARHLSPAQYWITHFGVYVILPILLLLFVHFILVERLDTPPLYIRIASMLIPLPFGFALRWSAKQGVAITAVIGALIGVVSVAGMLTLVANSDQVPIAPTNWREWQETIEYAASIALSLVTANIIGFAIQQLLLHTMTTAVKPSPVALRVAQFLAPSLTKRAWRQRAEKLDKLFLTIGTIGAAIGTGAGSIFTGIRTVLH